MAYHIIRRLKDNMIEYVIVIDCANCGEEIREKGVLIGDPPVEISPSSFTCERFICKSCGKSTYTGDLDILSEDEI